MKKGLISLELRIAFSRKQKGGECLDFFFKDLLTKSLLFVKSLELQSMSAAFWAFASHSIEVHNILLWLLNQSSVTCRLKRTLIQLGHSRLLSKKACIVHFILRRCQNLGLLEFSLYFMSRIRSCFLQLSLKCRCRPLAPYLSSTVRSNAVSYRSHWLSTWWSRSFVSSVFVSCEILRVKFAVPIASTFQIHCSLIRVLRIFNFSETLVLTPNIKVVNCKLTRLFF